MKRTLCILFVLAGLIINAQEEELKWKLSSFHISNGSNVYTRHPSDQINFKQIVEDKIDFGKFEDENIYYTTSSMQFVNLGLGFSKSDKIEYLFSMSWGAGSCRGLNMYYDEHISKDTFYAGGHTIIADSILQKNLSVSEENEFFSIDAFVLYKTDPLRTISLFAGYGLSFGFTIHSTATSYTSDYAITKYIIDGNDLGSNYYGYNFDYKSQDITLPVSLYTRVYFPLGMDIRLSKKENLFGKACLRIKTGFGFEHQKAKGYEGYLRSFSSFGMGIRFGL